MKRNLQDIDKLFRDALDDHLEPAPPGAWETVSNDLDKKQASFFKYKYHAWRRLAVALLIFVFAGIGWMLYSLYGKRSNNAPELPAVTANPPSVLPSPNAPHAGAGNKPALSNGQAAATEQSAADTHSTATTISTSKTPATNPVASAAHSNAAADQPSSVTENTFRSIPENKSKPTETVNNDHSAIAASVRHRNPHAVPGLPADASAKTDQWSEKNGLLPIKTVPSGQRKHAGQQQSGRDATNSDAKADLAVGNAPSNKSRSEQTAPRILAGSMTQAAIVPLWEQPAMGLLFSASGSNHYLDSIQLAQAAAMQQKAIAKKAAAARHGFSVQVFASPNYSFTRLENDEFLAGPGRNKNASRREEQQGASFSAGALVNYGWGAHLSIQSGLVFSSAKTNISPKIIYAKPDNNGHAQYEFNCSSGVAYVTPKTAAPPTVGDSIRVMGSSSTISYLGVPLSVNYAFQKGRFSLVPGIGMSVNFLTSGKSTTDFGGAASQKETSSITGLKSAYVDASIGIGAEYLLGKRVSISVRPLLRMAVTSVNNNTPVRLYQNYLAVETGLKIGL